MKLLLVHAYRAVAEALAIAISREPNIRVVAAHTGDDVAADTLRRYPADVVLLDQAVSGERGAAALRERFPQLKILMLTPSLDHDDLFAYVQAGAVGCVTMDDPLSELVRSIYRVHAGEVLFAPSLLLDLLNRSQAVTEAPGPRPAGGSLTPRELEVLKALATGMTSDEVAERLIISNHTVRTHLKNILRKLEARSKLEAIILAIREGLIEVPERSRVPEGSS